MSSIIDDDVTLEDLATMCEENHEELAQLFLQEVPFYNSQQNTLEETTIDHAQVSHLLGHDVITADLTDIAHEETCFSIDEVFRSAGSDDSISNLSPTGRLKTGRRKVRTPNTLHHLMERHRHSERKRHHSLNEQLKNICHLIPGSFVDNKETKVVMMQRVISYIAYLENSIKLLCCQTGCRPRPSWFLLTTNFASYFQDYCSDTEPVEEVPDPCDNELLEATFNLTRQMQDEEETGTEDVHRAWSATCDAHQENVPSHLGGKRKTRTFEDEEETGTEDVHRAWSATGDAHQENVPSHLCGKRKTRTFEDEEETGTEDVHRAWSATGDAHQKFFPSHLGGKRKTRAFEEENEVGCHTGRPSSSYPSRKASSSSRHCASSDSVVPVMVPPLSSQGISALSQISGVGVPTSSHGEDLWTDLDTASSCNRVSTFNVAVSKEGETDVFFSASMDDEVSAILEISSDTVQERPLILGLGEDYREETNVDLTDLVLDNHTHYLVTSIAANTTSTSANIPTALERPHSTVYTGTSEKPLNTVYTGTTEKPLSSLYTIRKHVPQPVKRRKKRKQMSPRRSISHNDYLSDKAYLPSWSNVDLSKSLGHTDRSPPKIQRTLPYNIRGNHRYPVQRLQAPGMASKLNPSLTELYIPRLPEPEKREPLAEVPEKNGGKLDLRKTSWMNGFMMFSRINRRSFIQAHPGVHTSHISKIMGHTWRSMSKEEQRPYREKAQLCSRELYRQFTGELPEALCSDSSAPGATPTTTATINTVSSVSQSSQSAVNE